MRVAFPVILPEVAVMVAVPLATAVAKPVLLLIVATELDELQVTADAAKTWFEPSEKFPLAVNCWVNPTNMLAVAGVTDMDDRVAEFTVRVVLPVIPEVEVAVMVALPVAMAVARPLLSMVATVVSDVLQVTEAVISLVTPPGKLAVALNCWVTATGMLGLAGVTVMEVKFPEVTVRVAVAVTLPKVAVMVALPAPAPVARPLPLMVATDVSEELQVTSEVISPPGETVNLPVAVNCWVDPAIIVAVAGVIVMEVGSSIPFPPPHVLKNTAKDPRANVVKTNPTFFMKNPPGNESAKPSGLYPNSATGPALRLETRFCLSPEKTS